MGYTTGIENYSRYFDGRQPGQMPYTLLDYFPDDYLMFIDESHITIPQIRAMFNGDRARKDNLVGYGFRLKSAYDNRPLKFEEFESKIGQLVCVSATPGPYEMEKADNIAEQIIRPTGLLDPEVEVRPTKNQIDDLIGEVNKTIADGGRVLITTLTKKMAENLATYLTERGIKTTYLHSEIKTMERIDVLDGLRSGETDVVVGINLLREGLDLPEVQLVCILDADKEGFLRSSGALIQTIGRAARNSKGRVIMYADTITGNMKKAIDDTARRRKLQQEYNREHGIVPKTIKKEIKNTLQITKKNDAPRKMSSEELDEFIADLRIQMEKSASELDFEKAIELRNSIAELTKGRKVKKDKGKDNK
jgi:excinuclease ABC subunit B